MAEIERLARESPRRSIFERAPYIALHIDMVRRAIGKGDEATQRLALVGEAMELQTVCIRVGA